MKRGDREGFCEPFLRERTHTHTNTHTHTHTHTRSASSYRRVAASQRPFLERSAAAFLQHKHTHTHPGLEPERQLGYSPHEWFESLAGRPLHELFSVVLVGSLFPNATIRWRDRTARHLWRGSTRTRPRPRDTHTHTASLSSAVRFGLTPLSYSAFLGFQKPFEVSPGKTLS